MLLHFFLGAKSLALGFLLLFLLGIILLELKHVHLTLKLFLGPSGDDEGGLLFPDGVSASFHLLAHIMLLRPLILHLLVVV